MEELKEDYQLALEGREYWLRLKKKYNIDDSCCLVICPTENKVLNKMAMENIEDYLRKKYLKKAVIVSSNSDIELDIPWKKEKSIYFEYIEQRKIEDILKYYRLTQFAKNIIVISLEEPYGNGNLIGKNGITLKNIIRDAIYV